MSKTKGFRNSGKLDLGGKNMEYVLAGALLIIIIVAVVLAVGPMQCGGGPTGPTGKPMFKCIECDKEWEVSQEDANKYHREMERGMGREMGDTPIGQDCPKCGKEGCVFMMIRCPKCKEYFLSKRYTDPDAFAKVGHRDICPDPECKTDVHEYNKKHRRR